MLAPVRLRRHTTYPPRPASRSARSPEADAPRPPRTGRARAIHADVSPVPCPASRSLTVSHAASTNPARAGPPGRRPLRVVHSALCTRVLLNLRKARARAAGGGLGEFARSGTRSLGLEHVGPTGALFDWDDGGGSGDGTGERGAPELADMGYFDA